MTAIPTPSRGLAASILTLLLPLLVACSPEAPPADSTEEAQIEATVVEIALVTNPGARQTTYEILSANGIVRVTDELDLWRLFDMENRVIITMNDALKTIRRETFTAVIQRRESLFAAAENRSRPRILETGESRVIAGYPARRIEIELGDYRREIWFSDASVIDPEFYRIYLASAAVDSVGVPAMEAIDRAFADRPGLPLLDKSELLWGEERLEVERRVVSIDRRMIDERLLEVPEGYEEERQ